jgi:hypothetical protein
MQPPAKDATSDAAGTAFVELADLLREIEAGYYAPTRRHMQTAAQRAAGRQLVAHALHHALQFWLEADPAHPVFHRFVTPTKKLLGDNPDAIYFTTVVDPKRRYRIRGNLAGAVYTSFSVEAGAHDGGLSRGVVATLHDGEIDVAADGSYEIVAAADPPARNGLRLPEGAATITTRHYWESETSPAADPLLHVPLAIEPLEDPDPAAPLDDAALAAGLRRVATFVRGVTIGFPDLPPEVMPAWVSREPNRFSGSEPGERNTEIGYAAKDIDYRQTLYEIGLDQALVLRGRFPRCRFANVVVWNHRLQTPPYRHRRVSLNRKQVRVEADGSFRIVVAHRDPGVANWLDAAGLESGMLFWRFLLPEEEVGPIETELVDVASVASRA